MMMVCVSVCVCEVNACVVVVADLLGWVVLGGGGVCGVWGVWSHCAVCSTCTV
jgi:hypothetical protein